MESKITETTLRNNYPQIFKKIDKIIFESRKYNLIDRFYHFAIENDKLQKRINSLVTDDETKALFICYTFLISDEQELLIKKIRDCYGLNNIQFHIDSQRVLFLDNPDLLGISPFLFNQKEWEKIILNEVEKFKHEEEHLNSIFYIIKNCLDETFLRLGVENFNDLIYNYYNDNDWDEKIKTSSDIFTLIVDDIIEYNDKLESIKAEEKKEKDFLKFEIKNKTLINRITMNYNFELIDKVFEKYFELTIPANRFKAAHLNFKHYLNILFHRPVLNQKNELVELKEEEVKKIIRFFWHYKSPNTTYNLFSYKVEDLLIFFEQITGLKSKTTWDKAHRDKKLNLTKNIEKEINSIIDKFNH